MKVTEGLGVTANLFLFTVQLLVEYKPRCLYRTRTVCESGRNAPQLPSFCKQFDIVSINTASCNGQSVFAIPETKTVLLTVVPSVRLHFSYSNRQFVLEIYLLPADTVVYS